MRNFVKIMKILKFNKNSIELWKYISNLKDFLSLQSSSQMLRGNISLQEEQIDDCYLNGDRILEDLLC